MKISKGQLKRIIKEERRRLVNESTLYAEERAGDALAELMEAYLETHLATTASNKEYAIEQASADLRKFVEEEVIEPYASLEAHWWSLVTDNLRDQQEQEPDWVADGGVYRGG